MNYCAISPLKMTVIDNYNLIRRELAEISVSQGKPADAIRIMAVCKGFGAAVVQEAIDAGIRLFGENRVQEAGRKIPLLRGDYTVHMIGHLQSNKARDAVELFDCIQSIDKLSTAQRVDIEAGRIGKKQRILIQVNASGEQSKSGIPPDSARELAEQILELVNLDLVGFMSIAPFTGDEDAVRKSFRITRELRDELGKSLGLDLSELSMGMSSDYRIAAEEGSTMVRIGTAIFGQRS
jgi:pyridoxal phosphate enzyme (YggS family)